MDYSTGTLAKFCQKSLGENSPCIADSKLDFYNVENY